MDLDLKGKRALITGGSRGIGRAIAEILAAEGCDLHLASRDAKSLAAAREEIRSRHNVAVEVHAADLSVGANAEALAERCAGIDILVNNAGAIPGGTIFDIDDERWHAAWDLKVFGYITLMRAFFREMCARGEGVIVNVIGVAGLVPDARYACGSTANAALDMLTRTLGGVGVDHGVRVVGVHPGPVSTDRMLTQMQTRAQSVLGDASRWQELLENLPYKRAATPTEVADVVAFLASPRASYVSGTVLPIDGGKSSRGKIS